MAKAVVATAYGGPEVLSLIEVDVGAPGPGQARVEIRAAGVNPIDHKVYSGARDGDPSKLPIRLGYEAAGVVTAVGEGAEGPAGPVHEGDEVIAYPVQGAYASEILAPTTSVVPKPEPMSFEQAGGLMLTGVTAYHALTRAKVGKGDTVLVHGAAGGVGLMAVQLAVDLGARVIGTASQSGHALLRQFGAEPVVYGDGLVERVRAMAPEGVDAAIDSVGTDEAVDSSIALVHDRTRVVDRGRLPARPRARDHRHRQRAGGGPGERDRTAARLELVRLVEQNKLKVVLAAIYPLSEAAAAHQAIQSGHTHGKIVLVP